MANTKYSNLPAAVAAADANEISINEAGTSKKLTVALLRALLANPVSDDGDGLGTAALRWADLFLASGGVINFNNGNVTLTHGATVLTIAGGRLVCAAGTTAYPGLQLTSGSLLTTPEAGAFGFDGKVLHFSPEANCRGVVGATYWINPTATFTFANDTNEQALFDDVGGGVLTLPTGLYEFECLISLTSMSATSGNLNFDLLGAGTAVFGTALYYAAGIDGAADASHTTTGAMVTTPGSSGANLLTAGTGTAFNCIIRGMFRITTAGTIIPSIAQTTAATPTLRLGSYFKCTCIGAHDAESIGPWS